MGYFQFQIFIFRHIAANFRHGRKDTCAQNCNFDSTLPENELFPAPNYVFLEENFLTGHTAKIFGKHMLSDAPPKNRH